MKTHGPSKITGFFMGDAIEYTGETTVEASGVFHVAVFTGRHLTGGHRLGAAVLVNAATFDRHAAAEGLVVVRPRTRTKAGYESLPWS